VYVYSNSFDFHHVSLAHQCAVLCLYVTAICECRRPQTTTNTMYYCSNADTKNKSEHFITSLATYCSCSSVFLTLHCVPKKMRLA